MFNNIEWIKIGAKIKVIQEAAKSNMKGGLIMMRTNNKIKIIIQLKDQSLNKE